MGTMEFQLVCNHVQYDCMCCALCCALCCAEQCCRALLILNAAELCCSKARAKSSTFGTWVREVQVDSAASVLHTCMCILTHDPCHTQSFPGFCSGRQGSETEDCGGNEGCHRAQRVPFLQQSAPAIFCNSQHSCVTEQRCHLREQPEGAAFMTSCRAGGLD